MIRNRNYFPRHKVLVWVEEPMAEDGVMLLLVDEFEKVSTARALFDSLNYGDIYEGNKILSVRLEVEYEEESDCLAEKDELAEHIYYEA